MIHNAILVMRYTLNIGHPSASREITLPAGTSLIAASNLPAGSRIVWWVDELPHHLAEDPFVESWHRNYGIGLEGDAVFLPNYKSEAPQPPATLD